MGVRRLATSALSTSTSTSASSVSSFSLHPNLTKSQPRQQSTYAATTSGRSTRVGTRDGSALRDRNGIAVSALENPALRTYYADWAEVQLPDKHRFPMEKYKATRLALQGDLSLAGKMEFLPSPVSASHPCGSPEDTSI
jgi:hypothetical protein